MSDSLLLMVLTMLTSAFVIAVFFFVRFLLKIEHVASHLDSTLAEVDRILPTLTEQSQKTLESLEFAALKTGSILMKVETPIENFTKVSSATVGIFSPQTIAIIMGFINAFRIVRKIFRREREVQKHSNRTGQ